MLMLCKAIAADRWLLASAARLPEPSRNFSYLISTLWIHLPNTSSTSCSPSPFTKLGILITSEGFSVSKERDTYRSSNLFLSFLTPISSQWPSSHSLCEALGLFSPSRAFVSDRHCGVVCERGVSFSLRWAEASSVLNSSSQSFHPAAQRLPAGDFLWKGSLSVWFLQQHFWWIIQNWRSCPGLGGLFFSQKQPVAPKNIWKLKSHVKMDETCQKHTASHNQKQTMYNILRKATIKWSENWVLNIVCLHFKLHLSSPQSKKLYFFYTFN